MDDSVQLVYRSELGEWQADFGDHHARGDTKARAIFELGLYLMKLESTGNTER